MWAVAGTNNATGTSSLVAIMQQEREKGMKQASMRPCYNATWLDFSRGVDRATARNGQTNNQSMEKKK
jgi:hypothetical protein